jgi:hypothetical protein
MGRLLTKRGVSLSRIEARSPFRFEDHSKAAQRRGDKVGDKEGDKVADKVGDNMGDNPGGGAMFRLRIKVLDG